ncbi:protoglobin domain-containing protein [Fontibacillus sp. BL9]|uniref:protoglobin domain-containing protein n=1 Tax=Fontibacillus sp. BL9 TaxID=3389971 RepID=UPI00397D8FEF
MKCPFSFLGHPSSPTKQTNHHSFSTPEIKPEWVRDESKLVIDGETEINEQLRMIDFHEGDVQLLHHMRPMISRRIDWIVNSFYQSVLDVSKLEEIIKKHSTVEKLKQTLREHLLDMFSGNVDQEFIMKRLRIAKVHKRVGLEPKWYLSAFQNLQNAFLQTIYQEVKDEQLLLQMVRTTTKLLNLEQQLVLEAYEKENIREKEEQYELVKNELKSKITIFSEELEDLSLATNAAVEELVSSSNEVSRAIQHSSETASNTREHAEEGRDILQILQQHIGGIHEKTSSMEESVKELGQSSSQIQKVVSAVEEIASRIKLLSLNASIEAARAGEHGLGFAVVAREVNKLSEEAKSTVVQIAGLVSHSAEISARVVRAIEEVRGLAEQGEVQSQESGNMFIHILNSMKNSAEDIVLLEEQIRELITTIEGIGSSTAIVAESAERLNRVSMNL